MTGGRVELTGFAERWCFVAPGEDGRGMTNLRQGQKHEEFWKTK
jgi:hypothetical protein